MSARNPNPNGLTIRKALTLLEENKLTTSQLMADTLTRIQETDGDVVAWLDIRPQNLMDTAAANDRRRSLPNPTTPLFGIPIGVKDIVDVSGYQTVCNMEAREDVPDAARDAEVVHQLRKSGVIFLGKTVTQEAAAGIYSDPCRNPWDTSRIPGGSSGGSAAAVANGTCLGAVGTDTGGSIRIPAALCGVTGLKPTYGRLPAKGIFPLSPSLDTPGPIARTVADTMALYLAMQGNHKLIPEMWNRFPESGTELSGKRIGVLTSYFNDNVQPDILAAQERALANLRTLGAEIVECDWVDAPVARIVAKQISRMECAQIHRDLLFSNPELMGEELRKRVEAGSLLPADTWFTMRAARERVKQSIAAVYQENRLDAILAPSVPATAPRVGETTLTYADGTAEDTGAALTRLTGPWNATGQPVFAIPAGEDRLGLPIGLSLVGRPDQEWELADIAHALECVL